MKKCTEMLPAFIARVGAARVGKATPANGVVTSDCVAALFGALPLVTHDVSWVVANPTCKHPAGTLVGVVPHLGRSVRTTKSAA